MLRMRGHFSFFAVTSYSCNGFCDIAASAQSQFVEYAANFDAFICIIKICCLLKKFSLRTCNNTTKTNAFTLQE